MRHWFGPAGFTVPRCVVDFRVGGGFELTMRAPDGADFPCRGVYHAIEAPARLVFTSSALDASGASLFDVRNTVTFVEHDGATAVRLEAKVVAIHDPIAPTYLSGMEAGWGQTLDRMAAHAIGPAADAA
jgi:uncharacterized protein YndB with AHSA1/START domain